MKLKVQELLLKALNELGIKKEVELTEAKGHADFSTNIAMKVAKELSDTPINIANKIKKKLNADFISNVEVAGPGFINIFMKSKVFFDDVKNIIEKDKDYGKGNQNKYVNVEYVSANPTGYLHVGHARGAVVGSVLVNVLRYAGNKVDAEYYINDVGNQIDVLAESVRVRYLQKLKIEAELPKESYQGSDIIDVANYFYEKYGDSLVKEKVERFRVEAYKYLLEIIKEDLKALNVVMDFYSSEQEMYDKKMIPLALKKLKKYIYEKDGATWLKTSELGDDKDRVLVKSDKKLTYFTPDIAYHNLKLLRGYDELINIWGADHIGYIKRMEIALKYLGLKSNKLDIFTVQLVKLVKNGKELKMSKRTGNSYTIKELIDEVGVDVARWFMIDRSNNSQFVFDINHATAKSSDNPVFNVQYTHARANQIIEKSICLEKKSEFNEKEKKLINLLNKFTELIEKIATTHKTHLLPQYLIEVSKKFNSWYSSEKIIGNKNEYMKVMLVKATKIIIKNGLELLGITCPNKM